MSVISGAHVLAQLPTLVLVVTHLAVSLLPQISFPSSALHSAFLSSTIEEPKLNIHPEIMMTRAIIVIEPRKCQKTACYRLTLGVVWEKYEILFQFIIIIAIINIEFTLNTEVDNDDDDDG